MLEKYPILRWVPSRSLDASDLFGNASDVDDESEHTVQSQFKRDLHHGSSFGASREVLSDRKSCIWKQRRGAKLAVVITSLCHERSMKKKRLILLSLSSRQNVVAAKKISEDSIHD
jgi:hypothetical protein